jgi:hypothetical protein
MPRTTLHSRRTHCCATCKHAPPFLRPCPRAPPAACLLIAIRHSSFPHVMLIFDFFLAAQRGPPLSAKHMQNGELPAGGCVRVQQCKWRNGSKESEMARFMC